MSAEKVTVCRYSACSMQEVVDLVIWAEDVLKDIPDITPMGRELLATARTLLWKEEPWEDAS